MTLSSTSAPCTPALAELRSQALGLRDQGFDRAAIARSLAVSTWRVTELLAGAEPRHPRLRARAKDQERAKARRLRREGHRLEEIVQVLGVARSSVSLWVRDLSKPEAGAYAVPRVKAARYVRWDALLAHRERERQTVMEAAHAEVGPVSDRERLLLGVVLYWAEGTKSKPWRRSESLIFTNSDADVIVLYLRWLSLLSVTIDRITAPWRSTRRRMSQPLTSQWARVTGLTPEAFLRP